MSAVLPAAAALKGSIAPASRPAWAAEVSLIVEQLGVRSFRAAVVDLARMATLKAWSLGEQEHPHAAAAAADGPLDSAFPGAVASLAELAEVAGEVEGHTAVTRLGPHRCLFVWRQDLGHAMVAEAHYHDAPTLVGEIDKALIRLLCQIGLGSGEALVPPTPEARVSSRKAPGPRPALEKSMPRPSRHRTHHAGAAHPWMAWCGRLLVAVGAVAALWLLLVGLPAVHSQAEVLGGENLRLQTLAEQAMARSLADVVASEEAGPLQAALAELARQGLLQAAAVSNAKDRVVATHGPTLGLKEGALAVAPADARGVDIHLGSRRVGRLWLFGAGPEAAMPTTARLVSAAWLAVLAFAMGSTLLAGQRWLRRHRL